MGAFKSLTSQDIIVSPLIVYGAIANSDTITFLKGKNTPYGSDDDETNPSPWPSASLIYSSIKQLYYSNTLANDPEPYIVINNQGNVVEGSLTANVNSRYDNFLQSGLYPVKNFPTGANEIISVGIIPQSLFGDYLKPNSVSFSGYLDDGQGNIFNGSFEYVGNIIYTHGIIILTDQSAATLTGDINVFFVLQKQYMKPNINALLDLMNLITH